MQLIPILTTIIIVATVSALIFIVGFYIIYKTEEKRFDRFVKTKLQSEKVVIANPENFGGRTLKIKTTEKIPEFARHYKPIGDSITKQQKYDKTYQENERKKVKRTPTEPKYSKITVEDYLSADEDRSSGVISWR